MKALWMLSFSLLLYSCDCVQQVQAVVLDKTTRLPIEKVGIQKEEERSYGSPGVFTDVSGAFEFRDISGGLGKCPDVVLLFEKDGYQPLKKRFKSSVERDTIYLERIW
ncbi:MAG: hypothetical protein JNJ57_01245 [Saprospiraceae bacterium]|nr:hypothetical protein [Saprospiraceae bacterium]